MGAGRLHKGQQNHFGGQINFPACWFQQLVLMIFDVPNWCAKYEYCMATSYLPVCGMVTKAIRPTEGTKIMFVCRCVGLLCHLSWHLPASGNHPSHQRWLWWPCRPAVTPWPDWYSSSVARPQVFIGCAVTSTQHTLLSRWKGAPFGVWRKKKCLENPSPSTWGGGTYILSPKGLGDSLSRAATMSSA